MIMDIVKLEHGAGGIEMHEILERIVFRKVSDRLKRVDGGVGIDILDDGATIPLPDGRFLILSMDSYTVNPIFFPGGDIGVLAVSGSINDVLMMGGIPLAMLDTIVVEEGFSVSDLNRIVDSMIRILEEENIALIGGDFKVMPKGQLDKIIITTTAIGISEKPIIDNPRPGDKIIVSDYVGDHGAVILLSQLGMGKDLVELQSGELKSDVKPLTKLMKPLIVKYRDCITAARDPTRGGLSGVLNEWASRSKVLIYIKDSEIPVREPTRRYSEMLGVDPLFLASEGVAVLAVNPLCVDELLEFIHNIGFSNARVIGEVRQAGDLGGIVVAETSIGGLRVVEPPRGELVPRIC